MRSKFLKIRVTEEEYLQAQEKAKQMGRSVSDLMRMTLSLDCVPIRITDAADERREQYMSVLCEIADKLNELTIVAQQDNKIDMAALASMAHDLRSLKL
ncbi:hypothetical protein SAMN05660284_02010 [Formivibrio citricus]|uniref:Uncharacterized protein n=1 Tax=Formivibrio citricus TaxID=83765 RepID=A0A1I5AVW9_9NEIS|nr:hypothetical protein [Formivibrio citricus]SFN66594.1 hypothetical protein SAMN05660284_02010 [Formivibrio citricus]